MTIIINNGKIFWDTSKIINKIADNFSEISSTKNYKSKSNIIRIKKEQQPLIFASNNTEVDNQVRTIQELHRAIEHSKNITPGSDHVTREMNWTHHMKQNSFYWKYGPGYTQRQ